MLRLIPQGSWARHPFLRLLRMVAGMSPLLTVSALLRVLSQGLGMALASLAAYMVARRIVGQPGIPGLWYVFAGLAVAKGLCRYGEQISGHALAFGLLARMRNYAYRVMETLAPGWPAEDQSAEVASRLSADVDLVEVFYAHTIGPAIAWITLSPIASLLAGYLGLWPAGIIMGISLVLVGAVLPWMAWLKGREIGERDRVLAARQHCHVNENLRGAEELLTLGAREQRLRAYEAIESEREEARGRLAKIAAAKDLGVEAVIILCVGGLGIYASLYGMALPQAATLVALGVASFAPALGMGRAFDDLPLTLAAARRYFELVDRKPELVFTPGRAQALSADRRGLELILKSPEYRRQGQAILPPLELRIPPGARVVVLGPSGCGKSTLLRLIARFYDPHDGAILLGGQDLRHWPEEGLRRRVSFLGQDPFFFEGTVRENLDVVSPGRADAEFLSSLDRAGLWPGQGKERLDRQLGLRGNRLSGGERKRLALARILLEDYSLVVLDEAFSNLDRSSRQDLRRHVLGILAGRTIMEASHEPEDIVGADRCIDLSRAVGP